MTKNTSAFRSTAPPIVTSALLTLSEPLCHVLPNGIPVYQFPDSSQKVVRFDLIFDAGSAYQNKLLVASTTNRMLKEGTKKFTAHAIAAKVDYYGAYLDLHSSNDAAYITLYCLEKHLIRLLPMVESMVTEPLFNEREFIVLKRIRKQSFLVDVQQNKYLASQLFTQKVYGAETPYGQTAHEKAYDNLTVDDLIEFHRKHYLPAKVKIIVSGAVSFKSLEAIALHFGNHRTDEETASDFVQLSQTTAGLYRFNKKPSLQSAIQLGKIIMPRSHPDHIGFLVLNTILGGYFGSRLMTNIREDKGYTYGIYSSVSHLRKETTFCIKTEVGTDVTEKTLQEIRNEIDALKNDLVTKDELLLVRNYLNGKYLRSIDGVFNMANNFLSILDENIGMEYFKDSLKAINEVQPATIQDLAIRYLDVDSMVTAVVGEMENPTE